MRTLHTKWGIACRIGKTIHINHNLYQKRYKKLRKRILEHEKEHSEGFTKKDLIMDLWNTHLKGVKKDYYHFIFTHPSALIEFLPFWKYNGTYAINPVNLLAFGAILAVGGWLLSRIL